jgi:CxxC motif-containing protein (DUF1111 family)
MRTLRLSLLGLAATALVLPAALTQSPAEAPTGFDNLTNGLTSQTQFDTDRGTFDEREGIDEGLGPLFNAQSCAECHQTPVSGAISQVTELRAGHFDGRNFVDHPGGSLINDRAINASIQERVLNGNEVRTLRTSLNTLGDGFIEAIDSNDIVANANRQPTSMRGTVIQVPVGEAGGQTRVGRFGWKNQHASLLSFSADAYLNEMGITSVLQPTENTSNGNSTAAFDAVPDPEDGAQPGFPNGVDVQGFTNFMRATKAPPRNSALASTADAQAGSQLFDQIGCRTCHTRTFTTSPPGTVINRGALTVGAAIGNKTVHPFSDFLLHDVGTGDGIAQNGGQGTRNQLRTPPLWGVRTRSRLMHDGTSLTFNDAILRHAGQATGVINSYRNLSSSQRNQIATFLRSL